MTARDGSAGPKRLDASFWGWPSIHAEPKLSVLGEYFHEQTRVPGYARDEDDQPAVYLWTAHKDEGPRRALYVGQTLNVHRRAREHLANARRGSVGREAAYLIGLGYEIRLAWRHFSCDCPLDHEEARLISTLNPILNIARGSSRGPECDDLCSILRARTVGDYQRALARPLASRDPKDARPLNDDEAAELRRFAEAQRLRAAGRAKESA